jgi:hypothetical protein
MSNAVEEQILTIEESILQPVLRSLQGHMVSLSTAAAGFFKAGFVDDAATLIEAVGYLRMAHDKFLWATKENLEDHARIHGARGAARREGEPTG